MSLQFAWGSLGGGLVELIGSLTEGFRSCIQYGFLTLVVNWSWQSPGHTLWLRGWQVHLLCNCLFKWPALPYSVVAGSKHKCFKLGRNHVVFYDLDSDDIWPNLSSTLLFGTEKRLTQIQREGTLTSHIDRV